VFLCFLKVEVKPFRCCYFMLNPLLILNCFLLWKFYEINHSLIIKSTAKFVCLIEFSYNLELNVEHADCKKRSCYGSVFNYAC